MHQNKNIVTFWREKNLVQQRRRLSVVYKRSQDSCVSTRQREGSEWKQEVLSFYERLRKEASLWELRQAVRKTVSLFFVIFLASLFLKDWVNVVWEQDSRIQLISQWDFPSSGPVWRRRCSSNPARAFGSFWTSKRHPSSEAAWWFVRDEEEESALIHTLSSRFPRWCFDSFLWGYSTPVFPNRRLAKGSTSENCAGAAGACSPSETAWNIFILLKWDRGLILILWTA